MSPPKPRPDDKAEARNIRAHALELLARREHSTAELAHKLEVFGHPPELIGDTLESLTRDGQLSDTRFTEMFIANRIERGSGPLKIRAELRERHVDDEVIDATLASLSPDWSARAAAAREKHFDVALPDNDRERARQARFLRGRGFSAEQVKAALERGQGHL